MTWNPSWKASRKSLNDETVQFYPPHYFPKNACLRCKWYLQRKCQKPDYGWCLITRST